MNNENNANFTPEQEEYKNLTPFKFQMLQNFPFIQQDFDSLTNYELLAKVIEYLNNVIENEQVVTTNTQNLYNSFVELQNYVNNYFDNLDVTDEINNKLDEMANNGTLTNLISNYVDPILESINNKVDNIASGSPLVAENISDMTDITRIYVLVTDGHWYYHDGTNWIDGGVYQATQIPDNSISLLLLDEDLQENFNYTAENLSLTDYATNKFMKKDGNLADLANATCKKYELEINKTYIFTGYDDSLLSSLVIKNENNEVVFVSNPSNQVKKYGKIFLVRENNLTAYISTENLSSNTLLKYTSGVLAEISNISTKNNELSLVYDIDNNFLVSSSINHTNLEIIQENSYRTLIYRMVKGQKYNIKSYDYSLVCGLLIIDFDYNKLYYSSNEDLHDTRREVNYTFTANKNGFIIISYYKNYYPGNIIIESNENSNIYGKRISFLGDSICQGVGDAIGGYGKIIADNNNMIYQNKGVAGGTITSGTYYNNTPRFWINEHINDLNIFSDYIILEGGVNDSSLGVPLGELSENYNSTLDINTFYGAFENMLKQLITRFKGKKYGYIFVHQMSANYKITNNPDTSYYYAAKKCCEKWGVPYLDLNDKVPPLGLFYSQTASQELIDLKTLYTDNGDGWHPNLLGYNKYYVPKIENWLNSL